MAQVQITSEQKTGDGWSFVVSVDGREHKVTVSESYWRQLTSGRVEPARLVEISFEFLLARESASAILGEFDLRTISKYFSEYEKTMGELAHDGRY